MNSSSQVSQVLGFATSVAILGTVAAVLAVMTRAVFSSPGHHSIPREDLERIARQYGWWAARRAEAVCPHNDVACVEREAKRLYEVMMYRR